MYIIVFIYKKHPHHWFSYIKLDFYTWPQNHLLRAPLHFSHQGGCASSRLDHGVDLQASRTKSGNASGSESPEFASFQNY